MPSNTYPRIVMSGPAWKADRRVRIETAAGQYAPGDYEHGEAQRLIAEGLVPKPIKEKVNDETS